MDRRKAHLLVITEDGNVKNLIERLIEHQRIHALVIDSVQAGAQFLQSNPLPDVVVLDLTLPDNHALLFLQQLRSRVEFAKLPVLVLTAFPDPDEVRVALEAGANRYLTKLFINKNLLSTLDEMVVQSASL